LPEIVISADTTDTFKKRLDKFWQHQDILYDYKVELTGVGNKIQINTDDNIVIELHFYTAYFSFAQAKHRGTCLHPLHIFAFALLCFKAFIGPCQESTKCTVGHVCRMRCDKQHRVRSSAQPWIFPIRSLFICTANFHPVAVPLDLSLARPAGFQAFSFLCTFVPGSEKTIDRTFAPVELSFHGTFAPWNFRSCGTFVPRERRFQELSFRGTFAPVELSFLGSERSKNFRSYETVLS